MVKLLRELYCIKKLEKIIDYAAVYVSGTFVGTNTDNEGNFRLDISKNASMPLSVSAVGYTSSVLKDRVFFDDTGYFDASGISWEGQMGTQRVGEVLPYEYAIK